MSIAEMKQIMLETIEHLEGEQQVEKYFTVLKSLDMPDKNSINLSQHYSKISSQFNDTLKKLAQ